MDDQAKGKPVGGRLDVRARLRMPFHPPEIETTTERWVFLDAPGVRPVTAPPVLSHPPPAAAAAAAASPAVASPASARATSAATSPATPAAPAATPAPAAASAAPAVAKPKPSGTVTSKAADEDAEDEDMWHKFKCVAGRAGGGAVAARTLTCPMTSRYSLRRPPQP